MSIKDPITVVGIMASLMLSVGGVMLYLTPAAQATEPPAAAPFSAPELTPEELAKLTPDERTRYDNLRESLQQVVQQLQALEQENTRLQQTITQGNANNQALDIEIDKLRPPQHVTPPTAP